MGFGFLRVLNDDFVAPGRGFDTHPHGEMEIVSIPLSGSLRHKDSEGNETVIHQGEIQIMSAGSGVSHSEYNNSSEEEVNFLQVWVLPEKRGIPPRYDQASFDPEGRRNCFQTIVSPLDKNSEGIKINQQSYFSLIDLEEEKNATYQAFQQGHGAYVFIIDGKVDVCGEVLSHRDAIGVEEFDSIPMVAKTDSRLLVIEVPMSI